MEKYFKKIWVDYLYKYIEVDDEEVEFINESEIKDKLFRLSNISQLGFASKIFNSATHTKLEHSLGVYYLSKCVLEHADLSSDIIRPLSFKLAALLHGIGHLPLSFATEVALLKASFLDQSVKDFIDQRVRRVLKRVSRDLNDKERKDLQEEMLNDRGRVNYYYRLFTTYFLLEQENKLREISNDFTSFNFDELLKYLTLPNNIGFKLLNHIDKLDYVMRDMFHVGLIEVDLNLPFYLSKLEVKTANKIKMPPEWKVLRSLEFYAKDKIYNNRKVKIAEIIYQNILMNAFLDSHIGLANLFEWNDDKLVKELEDYQRRSNHEYKLKEQIDKINSDALPSFLFTFSVSSKKCNAQNLLLSTGRLKSISTGRYLKNKIKRSLDYGTFKGTYLKSFESPSKIKGIMINLKKTEMKRFLVEAARYENYVPCNTSNEHIIPQCIWGDQFKRIDFARYQPLIKRLRKELISNKIIDRTTILCEYLLGPDTQSNIPNEVKETFEGLIKLSIKEESATSPSKLGKELFNKALLRNPDYKIRAGESFLDIMFPDKEEFLTFLKDFKEKRISKIKSFKEKALEYYVYMNQICSDKKREDQLKAWCFPSTHLELGEIDVWLLYVFKNKKPLLELIECTTSSSGTKRLKDREKLKQIRHYIKERFASKVDVKLYFNDDEIED